MTETQRQEPPVENEEQDVGDNAAAEGPTREEALQQITVLNKSIAETNDKMLRALAEVENIRRRSERERQDTAKFSVGSFARDLLNVADNLRRALNAIPPEDREKSEHLKTIFTGVEATERELLRVFESNGIRKVEPLNQKFDPNLHEVLFEVETADQPAGIVVQVVEPGYMIHDRLLRPARVGVAKGGDSGQKIVDENA